MKNSLGKPTGDLLAQFCVKKKKIYIYVCLVAQSCLTLL